MPQAALLNTASESYGVRRSVHAVPAVAEHSPTRRASRRRFLLEAGATVATTLGVTAAMLSPDPVRSAPDTNAGLDAVLIAACNRLIRASAACDADTSDLDAEECPLIAELEAAEAEVRAIPPRTVAGVAAKARLAIALGRQRDGTVDLSPGGVGDWTELVVWDLLRVAGEQVPA